ncbi:MAG: hypothetical protein ABIG94_12185, partial [Pseudomonadota bacterium]
PRIVRGQLLRSVTSGYKILDLWSDGTLIFIAPGDTEFLSWPKPLEDGSLCINPLTLAESSYLFAELSRQVYDIARPSSRKVQYRLEIRNMSVSNRPSIIVPASLKSNDWSFKIHKYPAPDSGKFLSLFWEGESIEPGEVAFGLVKQLYEWFGIEHEKIPYTKSDSGRMVIDPEKIKDD